MAPGDQGCVNGAFARFDIAYSFFDTRVSFTFYYPVAKPTGGDQL